LPVSHRADKASFARTADRPSGLFRVVSWLLRPQHFHYKLLAGTGAAVAVIVFLVGAFLFATLRNYRQDAIRAHTFELKRLSGVIENDIAALESYHRAYLLTDNEQYTRLFESRKQAMQERVDELTALIRESPTQSDRVMKAGNLARRWVEQIARPSFRKGSASKPRLTTAALGGMMLDQPREVLQSLQDEEQIILNRKMQNQEWAAQSGQILDFLPKLERAVIEMNKENQGYLLTGDNGFIEAYRRSLGDFYIYHGYLAILAANAPTQAQALSEVRADVELDGDAGGGAGGRRAPVLEGGLPARHPDDRDRGVRAVAGAALRVSRPAVLPGAVRPGRREGRGAGERRPPDLPRRRRDRGV